MKEFLPYVAGEFIKTSRVLEVVNPYNHKTIGSTYLCDASDLDDAIEAASKISEELKVMPSFKKYDVLQQLYKAIIENKKYFAEIICRESAKPLKLALTETERAAQTFLIAAEEAKRLPKEYFSLDWTPSGINKEGLVKYFPIGIVGGISPFNFPLNLAVHKIAPAIATGCPIILKPASATPLAMLALCEFIAQTELPKGAISVLPMDRITGNLLASDNRIKLLSFTGSPEVGWKLKEQAGKKKVVLELGGNAGVIISKSATLQSAINKCISGSFSYSGQVCIHTQRILVHESHFDLFVESFIEKTSKLKVGDPMNLETDISVVIDVENAIRVENWIKEAEKQGASVIYGGSREHNFISPTVITNTNAKMKVNCEEVFGPVVVIEKFHEFSDAINTINQSRFGLQAGIFTNNSEEIELAFNNLEVGGVLINETPTFRVDHMPYGGIKDSGFGREGVKYAMLDMLEPKLLVK
jgi:glyceraldehyde-3-phosphate dehydrogenase (NADP+)